MHTGIGFVEQEHCAEQDRAGEQLVPHAPQAGQHICQHGAVGQTRLPWEEEGDQGTGEQKADRGRHVGVLLGPQEQAAGQDHQRRAGAHGGGILAQTQHQRTDVQHTAAAQGVLNGAGHRHHGSVPQGDAGVGLRVAEHLLRP